MVIGDLTDEEFDAFYPMKMRKLSATHWTPVAVVRKAASFLVDVPGTKVLDLGSGMGKFCLVAASCTSGIITGVEMRENLVQLSRKLAYKNQLHNVDFVHANINAIDLSFYHAFYFFNSFGENINLKDKLDPENVFDQELYKDLTKILHDRFEQLSIGTRIVTYCGEGREIPESYALVKSSNKGQLKFWSKRY